MDLGEIIHQPEGRRLEFKAKLPTNAEMAKSIVAFANDAGGTFFWGIKDNPREIVGVDEEHLMAIEEKISNIIHDNCSPIILPDINFYRIDGKYILRTQIYKGSQPPYFLKAKGVEKGTFIRVGSSNRLASKDIIDELERQKRNISFDGEYVVHKEIGNLNLDSFKQQFLEKTGQAVSTQVLAKLGLVRSEQGHKFPTNALVLLSDDELHYQLYPYAKIECALFKGVIPGNFIDQKTISGNVGLQAEQAYQFVLRHISQGTTDYQGVYRKDRWEYPIISIREVIRNAVIHRDYSLTGKDIKIAVFDDKVEITSPGKLLPSVDFSLMEAGQSDIRNKVLAPVFKKFGIIEQWGNGLRMIANELKEYPEIGLNWSEPGLAFRIVFFKKNFQQQLLQDTALYPQVAEVGTRLGLSWNQAGNILNPAWVEVEKILGSCIEPKSIGELMKFLGWSNRTKFRNKFINPLLDTELVGMTIPEKVNSSKQKYYCTPKGKIILDILKKIKEIG